MKKRNPSKKEAMEEEENKQRLCSIATAVSQKNKGKIIGWTMEKKGLMKR